MNEFVGGRLDDLALFVEVVEAGGFTAASRRSGTPQATISRRIAALETLLGLRLLNRTTRRLGLTEAGARVFDHAQQMLIHAKAAAGAAEEMRWRPAGLIRVAAPVILGQAFISDIVAEFLSAHPEISVSLEWTTRAVDLIEEPVDVVVRIGRPADSGLTLVRLGFASTGLYAPPGWLGARPNHPTDLGGAEVYGMGRADSAGPLRLSRGDAACDVPVVHRLRANDVAPVIAAAKRGRGIAILPDFAAPTDWTRLLADWESGRYEINALTAPTRSVLPRVRLFLDALKAGLGPGPTGT